LYAGFGLNIHTLSRSVLDGNMMVVGFYYNLGATKIQMFDTASDEVFCVDFGSNPANGGRISIAACDDNAPGQRLYITDDHHIAVENGPGQCTSSLAVSNIWILVAPRL
jgi:hypothetical protein